MQYPGMEFRTAAQARRSPQTRILTIGIVGALHIAIVYALFASTISHVIHFDPGPMVYVPPKEPPPPKPKPVDIDKILVKPELPSAVPPDIDIQRDTGPTISTLPPDDHTKKVAMLPPPTGAVGVMSTHTIPAYPALAIRSHEQGTVTLRLSVAADGSVSDAVVEASSGSSRLDEAAVAWVIAHWRYKPAMKEGLPVASTTLAAVRFNLKDAR